MDEGVRTPNAGLWALLPPIRGIGGQDNAECAMLKSSVVSILKTTIAVERRAIFVMVAIDHGDPIYNESNVRGLLSGCGVAGVAVRMLHPGFFGNVCSIWNRLALDAIQRFEVDYLVLLGDDVVLETERWKGEIETAMRDMSARAGLPEGMACCAFRDLTMPAFPTFPVIHRRHVEILGAVLPPEFVNQGGDPFLFELYRRWGASAFVDTAALKNIVGGKDAARYSKLGVRWQGDVLTRELERFSRLVRPAGPLYRCLGVVVPTYRCDVTMLRDVVSLRPTVYPNVSADGRGGGPS